MRWMDLIGHTCAGSNASCLTSRERQVSRFKHRIPNRSTQALLTMLRLSLALCFVIFSLVGDGAAQEKNAAMKFVLVVHGGAGTIDRAEMTPENEAATPRRNCPRPQGRLRSAGARRLESRRRRSSGAEIRGQSAFQRRQRRRLHHEGTNELDAAIMDGKTLRAGAVAGVKHIRNPISLARMVMEKSPHVMFAGVGAEEFAKRMGMGLVDEKYFYTEERWQALQKLKRISCTSARPG